MVFRYTFRKIGGEGSDPSVKNVTLFFKGFPEPALVKLTAELFPRHTVGACLALAGACLEVAVELVPGEIKAL